MDLDTHSTEAATVAALALSEQHRVVKFDAFGNREFVALPTSDGGYKLEQITLEGAAEVLPPKIVTASVVLQETASLIEYTNRFKNFDSSLFADIDTNIIVAMIDYHKTPGSNMPGDLKIANAYTAQAQHAKHRATLKLPFALEWQTWAAIDGKLMKHVEFASFLEENATDILPLPPAKDASGAPVEDAPTTLLELCRELQVKSGFTANSAVRSGDYTNIEFQKNDDISTKKNVALPLSINLQIPVYFGERAVMLTAFMRRKVDDGSLMLGIKLMRPENVRQEEFHRIVGEVATQVELTTLYGKPA